MAAEIITSGHISAYEADRDLLVSIPMFSGPSNSIKARDTRCLLLTGQKAIS